MIELTASILSAMILSVTIVLLIVRIRNKHIPLNVIVPLVLIVVFYALVSVSNILEHATITAYFDPLEDVSEILFTLIFLFFINNWNNNTALLELKEKETWLRVTVNSIADGVITTDNEGRITHVNNAMEKLTGFNVDESVGRNEDKVIRFVDRVTKKDVDYHPINDTVNGEVQTAKQGKYLLKSKTGKTIPVSENTTLIKAEDSSVIGTVGIYRDMSEYESMTAQLTHIHKMEAIGQLAGGVAHDLNNMLGGVIGAADVLTEGGSLTDDQKEIVDLILQSSSRAADLTKNLLAFSRKGKILSAPVIIQDIINTTISIAEHTIDRQIIIEREIPSEPFEVIGDPGQLQNAFLNLLINARDAIRESGRIRVSLQKVYLDAEFCSANKISLTPGDYISIATSDNGSGIPEEIQDRIFEPFFTTKHDGKGTGLGLSAVCGTVLSHHGAITLKSSNGKGSLFTIYLPLYSGPKKYGIYNFSEAEDYFFAESGKILIIEDDDILRTTAKLMIQDMGFAVASASNGIEGVELFRRQKDEIKMVLLDMIMPEMNGLAVFEKIKEIDPSAKIIMTSGFSQEGRVPKDSDGFLPKPYRKNQLADIIKKVLNGK
ncbi:MAG TPA: ATP-binding protein [Spirochaetota bacterium]|mgnify:CR=1 FL=1|nr:ATP-binding protein [Spirochaetota bacterium]HQO22352.1 ATP-binding protein [Spirochaetota bacterium]